MKINRKPKSTRKPQRKSPVAPSNKMAQKENTKKELTSEEIKRQWEFYSRVGDSAPTTTKAETMAEYHKRITGEEFERPIITVYDSTGKTTEELEELATGHDMNLEGLKGVNYRTAIFLYVTGQKQMANKVISNRHRVTERGDDRVQSEEAV